MAKAASLILAVAIWFLIKDLLETQRRAGVDPDEATILGPAVNPDLQGDATSEKKKEPEKPTIH